jgi:hypothetical protein
MCLVRISPKWVEHQRTVKGSDLGLCTVRLGLRGSYNPGAAQRDFRRIFARDCRVVAGVDRHADRSLMTTWKNQHNLDYWRLDGGFDARLADPEAG